MPAPLDLHFTKYHGLGNDFILIDLLDHPEIAGGLASCSLTWSDVAPRLCNRHTGIGADGLLILAIDHDADARMDIVNADGSNGGMCGNGLRCVARHMFERWAWARPTLRVKVGDQILHITIHAADGRFRCATVCLGQPSGPADLRPEPVPFSLLAPCDAAAPGWRDACSPRDAYVRVLIPNPHAVFFCDDVACLPLDLLGPIIETHPTFPDRTNVHFVRVLSPTEARMRTWERGVGLTLACGSGACAALIAGVSLGLLRRTATIHLPGGDLRIDYDDSNRAHLTGPAERVFTGAYVFPVPDRDIHCS